MPRYIQTDEFNVLDDRLVYLTNSKSAGATTVDTAVLEANILDAESEIDGYIGIKYRLPLRIKIPRFLRLVAARITIYYLWLNKKAAVPEHIINNYNEALFKLREVSKGSLSLGAAESEEIDASLPTTALAERG